ncbi:MAG: S46 family peptidase [Thermoguttaceae bacterium]|jgi:hypothetical protein
MAIPRHWFPRLCGAAALALAAGLAARGDEGMWLFNDPPKEVLRKNYGFEPDAAWLDHLQRSSVRVNSGGSGSFVSSEGLVLTNHHVGTDAIQKLSTPEKDYMARGFYARTRAEELPCGDQELNVLMSIEDVTARINAAVKAGASPAEAERARRAAMNTIEQESLDKTHLRSDVVTLYRGAQYHLYRYKKYTDVRLVFAPEESAAFFGGDPDNFEYPRYDLDICFFRVYEGGKPAKIEHYLKWFRPGAGDGELVFVSGHPGRTDRLDTVAHLEYIRDTSLPDMLRLVFRREVLLRAFGERSTENARRAQKDMFGIQNTRKALIGRLEGLQDPAVMARKDLSEARLERDLQSRPNTDRSGPGLKDYQSARAQISAALETMRKSQKDLTLLEQGQAFHCQLFTIARTLVRLAEEQAKPNADRLREYRQSNLESLRHALFSSAPIYEDLETVKLADSLGYYMERAGAGDALVRKVLGGKSPRERAADLVRGTKLRDVAARRKLADGGPAAIDASKDPMILLARHVDPASREVRRVFEEQAEEPLRQAYAKIARVRFAARGTEAYPDATFTLRLAFGVVRGYTTEFGQQVPPWTTLGGAFRHAEDHHNQDPFALPRRWLDGRDRLNLQTPLNFVSTADIIGGNSGSPVVDRQGRFVGIIFDGNLESLVWGYVYSAQRGRATAVHAAAIDEALRRLYGAGPLADELGR